MGGLPFGTLDLVCLILMTLAWLLGVIGFGHIDNHYCNKGGCDADFFFTWIWIVFSPFLLVFLWFGSCIGGKIPYFDKVILFFQLCTAYGCGAMLQWSGNHIDNRNKNNEGRFNDDVNLVFTGGLGWLVGQFIICLFGMGLGGKSNGHTRVSTAAK